MDSFILKFEYQEKPHILEVRPVMQQDKVAYKVVVETQEVTFEKDENGHLRIIEDANAHNIDTGLLQHIAHRIAETVNQ